MTDHDAITEIRAIYARLRVLPRDGGLVRRKLARVDEILAIKGWTVGVGSSGVPSVQTAGCEPMPVGQTGWIE